MTPAQDPTTLTSIVPRLLAIPSPGERLPLDLLRDLVRDGWRDLCICERGHSGEEAYRIGGAGCGECEASVATVPAWGPGVVALAIGVANWGVDWGVAADWVGRKTYGNDPAGRNWTGPAFKSGKHMLSGGSSLPFGGLGICHLDSGGLGDAYERWSWPGEVQEFTPSGHLGHTPERIYTFDALRADGGKVWRKWLAWADALLAQPAFHEWLITYWLRKFWAPSWRASAASEETVARLKGFKGVPRVSAPQIQRACINARIRNSASSWAEKWAYESPTEQARRYVEAKRKARGEAAARRTERQVRFAMRAAAAIEAVWSQIDLLPA